MGTEARSGQPGKYSEGVRAGRHLEHVPNVPARTQDPAGRHPDDRDHAVPPVQEDGVDREPHAERVNRAAALQQKAFARFKHRQTAKAAHPFPPIFREQDDA
jgi:hypothetical protein